MGLQKDGEKPFQSFHSCLAPELGNLWAFCLLCLHVSSLYHFLTLERFMCIRTMMTGNSQDYYVNRWRWKSKDFFSSNFGITKHHFPQHLMFNQITKTYPNSREETYIPSLKRRDNKVHCIGCFILSLPYFNVLLSSHSVMSDSLQPHGLQHARLSSSLPSPGAWSNSCPLSR